MIRLFAMDVDGTLTDGGIYLDGSGAEWKRFDVRDGLGIAKLKSAGVEVWIISGRFSAVTQKRAQELGIEEVHQDVRHKLGFLKELAKERGIAPSEIAYIGDDDNDAECLKWSGRGFAPSDAQAAARDAADVVTNARGGFGAVREAIEQILMSREAEEDSCRHEG